MRIDLKILRASSVLCALVLSAGCEREARVMSSGIPEKTPIRNYRDVPAIDLTDQSGDAFKLSELQGRIWVANFIFTSCNAECLVLSHNMSSLQKEYADDDSIAFVSFSVDPETDNPERLSQYAKIRKADLSTWRFLTGDAGKLQSLVRDSFLLPGAVTPEERAKLVGKDQMLHSNKFAIVDATGKVRAYVDGLGYDAVKKAKEVISTLQAE